MRKILFIWVILIEHSSFVLCLAFYPESGFQTATIHLISDIYSVVILQVVPDEMQAQNPQTHKPLSTSYSDPLSPSFFQPTSSNQPGIMSPGIMSPGILSPEMLSPENSPPPNSPPATTFNSRPLNRHQMARHIRYETRRAKVEKVGKMLNSSSTF